MSTSLKEIRQALGAHANREKAATLMRFFRTGAGEYGEGDRFLGIPVPQVRATALAYLDAPDEVVEGLLKSPLHEERLLGLLILVARTERAQKAHDKTAVTATAKFYLANHEGVNNWDLVDLSCYKILGPYIEGKGKLDTPVSGPKHVVKAARKGYTPAKSELDENGEPYEEELERKITDPATLNYGSWMPKNLWSGFAQFREWAAHGTLWEKRIAMVTTYHFIALGSFEPTLEIATILLDEPHDLIQKSVGWMLRELGKRDRELLETFLKRYYRGMSRTALRYAIEKFEPAHRERYLKGKI